MPSPPPHPPGLCVWVWEGSEWTRSKQGLQAQGPQLSHLRVPVSLAGVTSDRLWTFIKIFVWSFPSPSSFGSNLPFQAPCLPYLCSARLPVARSLPSFLRPHLPAARYLPKCLLPDPLHFPLSSAGSRRHSCLLSPHLALWSFLVSSEVAADSVCGSGGLYRLTLQT